MESEAPLPPAQDVSGPGTTGLTFAYGFQDQAHDYPPLSSGGFDQGLGFLDESASSNLEFWDLLPNNYLDTLPTDPQLLQHDAPSTQKTSGGPQLTLSGVDLLGTINFDEPDVSQALISKDLNASLQQYMADQLSPRQTHDSSNASTPPDTLGSDHGTSVGSVDDNATIPPPSSLRSVPTVVCGCLSSLYLALDSLTRLPDEVVPAMRVARNASKVAYDVIQCSTCSKPLIDEPTKPPPIQCFQNLMLLGTLVPSACNAYATILEMVDAETAAAKKHGRSFWFSFKDIGGLWGCIGDNGGSCPVIENYNNKNMEPDMWRLTIRGLLRFDVYGMDGTGSNLPKSQRFTHPGLRDVVKQLEERSRKRHEILDALIAAGHPHDGVSGVIYPSKPCTPEQRTCVRVLETARIALENLVIA